MNVDSAPGSPRTPRRCRLGSAGLGALVALGLLSACGLGDKSALEGRITSAPSRVGDAVVTGSLTVESRLVDIPTGGVSGFGGFAAPGEEELELPEEGISFSTRTVDFTMDLANDRAALRRADAEEPYVLIDDLVYFGRRAGVPDDDARPWVRVALDDLAEGTGELDPLDQDRDTARAVSAIHPAVVTDLVAGALTGSIEASGSEAVVGVEATRYDVNIAFDKAFRDTRRDRYPEERLEAIEALIEALGVEGNVHPATVWLDDDGRLRRFTVHLTQRPVRHVEFALIVTVEIESYGGSYSVDPPTPRQVLSVDSVLRFVETVTEDRPEDDEIR